MKSILFSCMCFIVMSSSFAQQVSPLAYFSEEWNDGEFEQCNTAKDDKLMSAKEKEVVYIINLVRSYPELFATTVVSQYPALLKRTDLLNNKQYYQTLMATLKTMEQQTLVFADKSCYASANCHAQKSGASGYVGHDRKGDCKNMQHFMGECCDYGHSEPVDIVLALLLDEGVPSLGHRKIILGGDFESIGVSIRPHKKYRYNAVIDFY